MSNQKKPRKIIGKRVRLVIGEKIPKEEDDSTSIIGQDTLLHVRPEEIEEDTQIIGEQVWLVVGNSKPAELIRGVIKRAQETDPKESKEIVELGKSVLSSQDKLVFKRRLAIFIEKCREKAQKWAWLAPIVIELAKTK